MNHALKINNEDTVAVALVALEPGMDVFGVTTVDTIPVAHKVALKAMAEGEAVLKYGNVISLASQAIAPGEHVHTHNMRTSLDEDLAYTWQPETSTLAIPTRDGKMSKRRSWRCSDAHF